MPARVPPTGGTPALVDPAAAWIGEHLRELPRHRHQLTREQVRGSQAARIIQAAAEVIAQQGYAAATVSAIATRAGVSRKTFYELFQDKEAALLAAYAGVEVLIDRTLSAQLNPDATDATAAQQIEAATRGLLKTLAAAPAFTQMFFIEALGAGPRVRQRRDAAIEQVTAALTPRLADLEVREGPAHPPIERDLVRGIVGAGIEAIIRHLVHDTPATLETITPTITTLVTAIALETRQPS